MARPEPPAATGPSGRAIARASAFAFAGAMLALVAAVLPAEYGVDPLGTGRALGLLRLASPEVPAVAPAAGGPVYGRNAAYRLDRRQITVPSLGSIEFKYELPAGAGMLYDWRADAPIDFDFHTEPAGRPAAASETFERGEADAKRGAYIAPYDGIHGWYWENLTDRDVVVTLEATGFFTGAVLFPPGAPPRRIVIPARGARSEGE